MLAFCVALSRPAGMVPKYLASPSRNTSKDLRGMMRASSVLSLLWSFHGRAGTALCVCSCVCVRVYFENGKPLSRY